MPFPLTLEEFRSQFRPTFDATSDALVQAKLNAAEEEIDASIWGAKAEFGHGLLTAHKLAIDPAGRDARLVEKDGTSTYWTEYDRLAQIVGGAYRAVLE